MGVSLSGGRGGRGGIIGGGDLRLPPTEHSCTVHYNQAHYVPVFGGSAEAGVKGGQVVVGAGRLRLGDDVSGVSGGETGRGRVGVRNEDRYKDRVGDGRKYGERDGDR